MTHRGFESHPIPFCGISITVIMPAFQAGDVGSIPIFRSNIISRNLDMILLKINELIAKIKSYCTENKEQLLKYIRILIVVVAALLVFTPSPSFPYFVAKIVVWVVAIKIVRDYYSGDDLG